MWPKLAANFSVENMQMVEVFWYASLQNLKIEVGFPLSLIYSFNYVPYPLKIIALTIRTNHPWDLLLYHSTYTNQQNKVQNIAEFIPEVKHIIAAPSVAVK